MSVLFIGKRFYTNRDALREKYGRIYQLPWHWSQAGIETKLWLVDYHTRETVRETDGSLRVVSTPVRNLALFRHWLSGRFTRGGHPDVVVASGDCYIGWLGLRVARRLRARFVFDVYDKYDEFAGYHTPPGFDLFRHLLTKADVRLFASRALMEQLQHSSSDSLLPNGLDVNRFTPRDMATCRGGLGLPSSETLVGYFGGMGADRGVADLIEAVQILRAQGSGITLVLGGKPNPQLDLHQEGVIYVGDVPYERMPDALAACDLLAIPYRRSPFMDAGSSNKIAEAMACRRPIVSTRTPNVLANFPAQAEQLGSLGLLAEPGSPESLARSIRMQAEQRVLVELPFDMTWRDLARRLADRLGLLENRASELAEPEA